ncbi:hypothetical protein GB931_02375 [Modestobacter sp. I12A-02628]|uniref:Dienelactone hydrolase family protein n=1 Tax=Goekera deserti TaxID=2497753 RepID=A0A7K3WEW8_9ACTN|nr:dienelactone hydrolase family protein [Goekera deserti]MPQ96785.1 hypothetical protein [Goekera deserti]NDI46901.1 hypothetical protein [Goekera deserti]NEL54469.1 dienelactone hydrolase family protein [Goekera deserti]
MLDQVRGELYCSYADEDFTAPPAMVARWEQLLADAPVRYQRVAHPGVQHGYTMPTRDVHDPVAAERDWELVVAMLRRQLPVDGVRRDG